MGNAAFLEALTWLRLQTEPLERRDSDEFRGLEQARQAARGVDILRSAGAKEKSAVHCAASSWLI